jgi:DNA-binding MarR family transcriptional regulator
MYKLHILSNTIAKVFDEILLQQVDVRWSQMTILLAIREVGACDQSSLARFLGVSPAAISRQVEKLIAGGYTRSITTPNNRRQNTIQLTNLGRQQIEIAVRELDHYAQKLFRNDCDATSLESHLAMLLLNSEEVLHDLKP